MKVPYEIQVLTGAQLADYYRSLVDTYNTHEATTEILVAPKKFKDIPSAKNRIAELEARLTLLKTKEKPKIKTQKGGSVKGRNHKGQRVTFSPCKVQTEPREGTIKHKALMLTREGCSIEALIELIVAQYAKTDKEMKCSARYRGHQVLRLLSSQNGYGFKQEKGLIYVIEN